MIKNIGSVCSVKKDLEKLKGQIVNMQVNRGRRKIEKYVCQIKDIYPSVFTVVLKDDLSNVLSYSYTEVLCGNVKINIAQP